MKEWYTGSNEQISFEEILEIILEHSSQDGAVYVGSDSMIQKQKCIFCTAVCLLGETNQSNRYFVQRTKIDVKEFKTLLQRTLSRYQY